MRTIISIGAALAVMAAQPLAAAGPAPASQAVKGDIACLLGTLKISRELSTSAGTDARKQNELKVAEQALAFFVGKLAVRYPGKKASDIVTANRLTPDELRRLVDMNRCGSEFKGALGQG